MLTLAHRGDRRAGPENSLAALVAACRRTGVDGVEFDVRSSADRVPVLVHDASLDRVLGTRRRVAELTASQLSALGIATLEETLSTLPEWAFLDVELKEDLIEEAGPLLARSHGTSPGAAVVSSFDAGVLDHARAFLPGWRRWLNVHAIDPATVRTARELGCDGVSCEYRGLDPRTVGLLTGGGLRAIAWPVARRSTVERLSRLGVYAVCADGPALGAA